MDDKVKTDIINRVMENIGTIIEDMRKTPKGSRVPNPAVSDEGILKFRNIKDASLEFKETMALFQTLGILPKGNEIEFWTNQMSNPKLRIYAEIDTEEFSKAEKAGIITIAIDSKTQDATITLNVNNLYEFKQSAAESIADYGMIIGNAATIASNIQATLDQFSGKS